MLHLDPGAGGRVTRLAVGGIDVLAHVDVTSPFHWGCFIMAPWAGRIRRGLFEHTGETYQLALNWDIHAIHGTVVDRPWKLAAMTPGSAVLECRLGDRWPWRGQVRHHVTLREARAEFRLEVHAEDEPFPAATGWHPWFRRRLAQRPVEIKLDAAAMLLRDAEGIPSGERVAIPEQPWDDCFDEVRWPVTLLWPDALRLEVTGNTRYAVVYTEPADAVCVEPQTGPPDALTLDPVVVTPDQPLSATMAWDWQRL